MVWIFDEVSFEENDVCFLCASYYVPLILSYGYMKKIMCASCVLPTMYVPLILSYGYNLYEENDVCFLLCSTGCTQEHPSSPISIESGTHTKQATFLGSTHVCFLCATFCDIINEA